MLFPFDVCTVDFFTNLRYNHFMSEQQMEFVKIGAAHYAVRIKTSGETAIIEVWRRCELDFLDLSKKSTQF